MRVNRNESYFSNPDYLKVSTAIKATSLNKRAAFKVFRITIFTVAIIAIAQIACWYIN